MSTLDATTLDVIVDRVRSVCGTLGLIESAEPFSFKQQPTGAIDGCFRIVDRSQRIIGGMNYTEERTDQVVIWVAKKYAGEPTAAKQVLTRQMHSLTAAVTYDGHITSGDYSIPDDGRAYEIRADQGAEYAVLQLTIPVNYETSVI
jgi:hypothetical protein